VRDLSHATQEATDHSSSSSALFCAAAAVFEQLQLYHAVDVSVSRSVIQMFFGSDCRAKSGAAAAAGKGPSKRTDGADNTAILHRRLTFRDHRRVATINKSWAGQGRAGRAGANATRLNATPG